MTVRFATFESAALFASLQREDGYFAEVLHTNVGHLWGPLVAGGFSVLVSEFAADEGEEVPELNLKIPFLPAEFSAIVAYATLGTLAILMIGVGIALLMAIRLDPTKSLFMIISLILSCGVLMIILSLFGWFLSEATRIYRDSEHRLHPTVRMAHVLLAILLIV